MGKESEPKEPEPNNKESLSKKISRRKLLVNALLAVSTLSGSCSISQSCVGQDIGYQISALEDLKHGSVSIANPRENNLHVIPKDNLIIILAELDHLYTKKFHAITAAFITLVIGAGAAFFARKIESEKN